MSWGIHPAIPFDKALTVGQEVRARFTKDGRTIRFHARVLQVNKNSVRVEAVEDVNGWRVGQVFVLPRFCGPRWSYNNSLYPR